MKFGYIGFKQVIKALYVTILVFLIVGLIPYTILIWNLGFTIQVYLSISIVFVVFFIYSLSKVKEEEK